MTFDDIECPVCGRHFHYSLIERHVSDCLDGGPTSTSTSSTSTSTVSTNDDIASAASSGGPLSVPQAGAKLAKGGSTKASVKSANRSGLSNPPTASTTSSTSTRKATSVAKASANFTLPSTKASASGPDFSAFVNYSEDTSNVDAVTPLGKRGWQELLDVSY